MKKNKPQETTELDITESNILTRVNNHFGYSAEEDEYVLSSDNIRLKEYEYITETYNYEKPDKTKTMRNIINNLFYVAKRLKDELAKQKPNQKFVKRCHEIIKNDKDMILRDRAFIEKQMKLNVAQIIAQHTL